MIFLTCIETWDYLQIYDILKDFWFLLEDFFGKIVFLHGEIFEIP